MTDKTIESVAREAAKAVIQNFLDGGYVGPPGYLGPPDLAADGLIRRLAEHDPPILLRVEEKTDTKKVRLLKLCRLKRERPVIIADLSVVFPTERNIYETAGILTINGDRYYDLRLVGLFGEGNLGDRACLPINLFNDICEFVSISPMDGREERLVEALRWAMDPDFRHRTYAGTTGCIHCGRRGADRFVDLQHSEDCPYAKAVKLLEECGR